MQPGRGSNMRLDQLVQRHQQFSHGTNLVSQGREAELHAFTRITFRLAVERLMLAIFLEDDHGKQAGACPAARDRVERGGRLADLFAIPAGELFSNGLNHLPRPRHHLQRIRNVFAHLHDPAGPAAGAGARGRDHHTLTRQMFWEGLADRLAPIEGRNCRLLRRLLNPQFIRRRGGFQILELQLKLIDQLSGALGAAAILCAPQQGYFQLQRRNHSLRG